MPASRHHTRCASGCRRPATVQSSCWFSRAITGLPLCGVLCSHQLAVMVVSDPWDALIAARHADVIVTEFLFAGSLDGVALVTRLRRDARPHHTPTPTIGMTACTRASKHPPFTNTVVVGRLSCRSRFL